MDRTICLRRISLAFVLLGLASSARSAEGLAPDSSVPPLEGNARALRLQRLKEMGAHSWHDRGHQGEGVTVAILDSGFRGYRSHLGKALPADVEALSFRCDGNLEARDSQHGILCGEVIHALAPKAKILLANWEPDRPDYFLAAIRWARHRGARIISSSVITPNWSDGEGGGPVHEAIRAALANDNGEAEALFFACAGNTAERHWSGPFAEGEGGWHTWSDGSAANELRPWGAERVSVELCWKGAADFDLVVEDAVTNKEVQRSDAVLGVARTAAVVRIEPDCPHTYRVRVRRAAPVVGRFHLVALGAVLGCSQASGSIPFPADGPEIIAVGAVNDRGQRHAYSSCGPNSKRPKPEIVAQAPFPSLWRARPFSGTSAAAPQAAGMAALIWGSCATWTADQVRGALLRSAKDLGAPGHDFETGFGLIQLPQHPLTAVGRPE